MSTVVVTGADGFVGSHLLHGMAPAHEMHGLAGRPDAPGAIEGLPRSADAVVHLAAMTDAAAAAADPAAACRSNCECTFRLLEYARAAGASLFVYASTGSVYPAAAGTFTEDTHPEPGSVYALTKYLGELAAAHYASSFSVCTLRLFHPFGPGQGPAKLVPRLARSIREGRPVRRVSEARPRLSLIYIDDLVEVIRQVVARGRGGTYNVASYCLSFTDLARGIGAVVGATPVFTEHEAPAEDQAADCARLKRDLGLGAPVPLETALRRTLDPDPGSRGA